jgi:hypothetical protein
VLRVVYGEGAHTAYFVPRDDQYRVIVPSAATYEILDLRRGESDSARVVVAAAAATIDSVSTTLDASAGPGNGSDYLVPLTATTNVVVGHTYRIQQNGDGEAVTVAAITSGASVTTLGPLQRDYTSGASFLGCELSCSIPTTITDDEDEIESAGAGPFVVIWRYTHNGRDYVLPAQFFLSRYILVPPVTEAQIAAANPPLAQTIAGSAFKISQAIAVAHRDWIADLEAMRIDPAHTLMPTTAEVAVSEKTQSYLEMWRGEDDRAEKHEARYRAMVEKLRMGLPPLGTVDVKRVTATAEEGSSTRRRGVLARS